MFVVVALTVLSGLHFISLDLALIRLACCAKGESDSQAFFFLLKLNLDFLYCMC